MESIKKFFTKIKKQFPIRRLLLVVGVVIISIATNDIKLRYDSFIKNNYWFQLLIVGAIAFISFSDDMVVKSDLVTKLISTVIVMVVFLIIAAPKKITIKEEEEYIYKNF